jgi:hypothetical protein
MTDIYLFLSGVGWMMVGMWVFAWVDPEGEHDDILMGSEGSLLQMGIMLALWPITLIAMWLRGR